jgi:hypothetical protein
MLAIVLTHRAKPDDWRNDIRYSVNCLSNIAKSPAIAGLLSF